MTLEINMVLIVTNIYVRLMQYWRQKSFFQHFAAETSIIGQTIRIGGRNSKVGLYKNVQLTIAEKIPLLSQEKRNEKVDATFYLFLLVQSYLIIMIIMYIPC